MMAEASCGPSASAPLRRLLDAKSSQLDPFASGSISGQKGPQIDESQSFRTWLPHHAREAAWNAFFQPDSGVPTFDGHLHPPPALLAFTPPSLRYVTQDPVAQGGWAQDFAALNAASPFGMHTFPMQDWTPVEYLPVQSHLELAPQDEELPQFAQRLYSEAWDAHYTEAEFDGAASAWVRAAPPPAELGEAGLEETYLPSPGPPLRMALQVPVRSDVAPELTTRNLSDALSFGDMPIYNGQDQVWLQGVAGEGWAQEQSPLKTAFSAEPTQFTLRPEPKPELKPKPEPDEIAATARRILDSVNHEAGPKWDQSAFLSLMRDFRDGKKQIIGPDIHDVDSAGSHVMV